MTGRRLTLSLSPRWVVGGGGGSTGGSSRAFCCGLWVPGGLNFSIWGASWAHFACLVEFAVALERFECVLEGLGIDCGGLWGAAGWISEASMPYFSQFWLVLAYAEGTRVFLHSTVGDVLVLGHIFGPYFYS